MSTPGPSTGSAPIVIRPGTEGRLIVLLPYSPERVAKIKSVAGRRWGKPAMIYGLERIGRRRAFREKRRLPTGDERQTMAV